MSSTNPSVPGGGGDADQTPMDAKGQLISKFLFDAIVSTKKPTKYFWISVLKFFVGILVQTIFSKRNFEIN